jgi:hypothetical protein
MEVGEGSMRKGCPGWLTWLNECTPNVQDMFLECIEAQKRGYRALGPILKSKNVPEWVEDEGLTRDQYHYLTLWQSFIQSFPAILWSLVGLNKEITGQWPWEGRVIIQAGSNWLNKIITDHPDHRKSPRKLESSAQELLEMIQKELRGGGMWLR